MASAELRSHAQLQEDRRLWSVLSHIENGTYVEVGVCDAIYGSITYGFYQMGWRGICVEPVKRYMAEFKQARPEDVFVPVAAGSHNHIDTIHVFPNTAFSTLNESVAEVHSALREMEDQTVPVETLDEILWRYEPYDIHFMIIDVEGYEKEVISGANLKYWRPWYLVVESIHPALKHSMHEGWEQMILDAGYVYNGFDTLNRFYSLEGKPPIAFD